MKATYFVSKQSETFGKDYYEVWKWIDKVGYFGNYDDHFDRTNIREARLKDVIAKLSALHPNCEMTKKFDRHGEPEWVVTFRSTTTGGCDG